MIAREGGCFTLLLIDLDGFKKINDTLGHDAGDALLKVTATRLTQAIRETDQVARLGGDEFAIVLTGTRELLSVEIVHCRRILKNLAEPVVFKDKIMRVSATPAPKMPEPGQRDRFSIQSRRRGALRSQAERPQHLALVQTVLCR